MAERRRRHWGWGYEDDPKPGEGAAGLAAHLGFGSAELEAPVPVTLPPPRVPVPPALAAICTQDPHARAVHAHGASYLDVVRALRGHFPHAPDAVARPVSETELVRVLEWCAAANLAVAPYGGGTSVVGGVDPVPGPGHAGAVSLDLGRLDRVLEVDTASRSARIQAGANGPRLETQLDRARDDAAVLPAVVRAVHARRLARHARGRALRHRPDPHRRPRRVDPRRHRARRGVGVAAAAGVRRRPVAGPAAARVRGHARRHHRGVGARAPARRCRAGARASSCRTSPPGSTRCARSCRPACCRPTAG